MQKKIGWNEKFTMFVYVPFKKATELKDALRRAGYIVYDKEDHKPRGTDKYFEMTVTPADCAKVHTLIDNILL